MPPLPTFMATLPPTNSLGLDFTGPDAAQEPQNQPLVAPDNVDTQPGPQSPSAEQPLREKKKPYVNPDRVRTGGPQREKLTDEELAERMTRMREQNEKIKQRRLDVAADEAAFKQTQELERQKMDRTKKIQDNVDRAREQNIKRKMDKAQNREWDSGKPATSTWKHNPKKSSNAQEPTPSTPAVEDAQAADPSSPKSPVAESGSWTRGGFSPRGGRGRGRGRGRGGRGGSQVNPRNGTPAKEKEAEPQTNEEKKEAETPGPPLPS